MSESPPPADDRDQVVVKDPEGSEEDKGEKKEEGSYSRSRSRQGLSVFFVREASVVRPCIMRLRLPYDAKQS